MGCRWQNVKNLSSVLILLVLWSPDIEIAEQIIFHDLAELLQKKKYLSTVIYNTNHKDLLRFIIICFKFSTKM